MNTMQKNIIISVTFVALVASLFLSDSNIVHAVLSVVAFIITVLLNMSKSAAGSSYMSEKRVELIEMMEFSRNKIVLNENTQEKF